MRHGFEPTAPPRLLTPVPPHTSPARERLLPRSSRRRSSSAGASGTSSTSRCAAARARRRTSSTRARRPPTASPARTTCWRACSRTSSRATRRCAASTSYRKGGWDCHGLPVEIAVEQQLGIENKAQIEEYGIAEFNAKCRESVFEFLEDWDAADRADRLLGRPRRPVPDARHRLHRVGLVGAAASCGTRACSTRATRSCRTARRCGTALSAHEVGAGLPGRRGPERLRPLPGHKPARRAREGDELLVWTTTPWTLVSNAAVAVDPELDLRAHARDGERARRGARRRACSARTRRSPTASRARDMVGAGYEPPFPYIPASEYGEKGHTVLPGDFVSAEDGTGIVHTAIAFGEDDFRLGAEQGLDGRQPGRLRRHLRRAHRPVRRALRQGRRRRPDRGPARARPAVPRRATTARLPALLALRHAAALLRQAVLVHPHVRSSSDRLLAANETRRLAPRAHQARALRAAGWRTTSTGRSRASATGARRCRSGATRPARRRLHRLVRRAGGAVRRRARGPAPPVRRRRRDPVRRPAASRCRRVPEVIDVWFDSGSMPFAQWHAPFENQDEFERAVPGGLHLRGASTRRAAGSTRCSPISTLLFDQIAPTRRASASASSLDPRARRCRSRGATSSSRGRSSTATAPTPSAGTSSPPSSRGTATASTPTRSASRCASSCCSCGTPTASTSSTRTSTTSRRRDAAPAERPRPLGAVAAGRDGRDGRPSGWTTTTPRAPAGRSPAFVDDLSNWYVRRSRRRFWDGDPAAFATLRTCLVDRREAARAVHARSSPTRSTTTSTASEPSVHLCDWPEAGERDEELEFAMAIGARDRAARARRPRPGQAQGAPAAARGGRRRRRRASATAIERLAGRRARRAQRQGAALRLAGRRARLLRGQAQLPRARPALRQAHAAGRGRGRRARPAHVAAALRDGRTRGDQRSTATTTSSAPTT